MPEAMIAAMLMAAPATLASANPPKITSAYTKFDHNRCTRLAEDKETGSAISRCPGYRGIPLFLSYDDEREDLDAGLQNQASAVEGPMHNANETIEWRLADGKPFAIIFRIATFRPYARWARLIVETIGEPDRPGCPIAEFDAFKRNANVAARRAADAVLTGKAGCVLLKG